MSRRRNVFYGEGKGCLLNIERWGFIGTDTLEGHASSCVICVISMLNIHPRHDFQYFNERESWGKVSSGVGLGTDWFGPIRVSLCC